MNHYKIALACLVALFASFPVMAKDGNNCGTGSSQVKASEMKDCLARMNEPGRINERQQQAKRDACEQNAKNRKLQGNEKTSFISSCMNENQAAAAHASVNPSRGTSVSAGAPPKKAAAATKKRKTANSCVMEANKKGLKGKERHEFLKTCKPQ